MSIGVFLTNITRVLNCGVQFCPTVDCCPFFFGGGGVGEALLALARPTLPKSHLDMPEAHFSRAKRGWTNTDNNRKHFFDRSTQGVAQALG